MKNGNSAMPSTCKFVDHDILSKITHKKKLGQFINQLIFHFTKKENNLQFVFVSDDYLHAINLKYLQHDTYTDIITFNLSENDSSNIDAEIYISMNRVKENATLEKVKYQHELLRVIIHGALHLCGFDDKTKAQKAAMRSLESSYIEKYLTG